MKGKLGLREALASVKSERRSYLEERLLASKKINGKPVPLMNHLSTTDADPLQEIAKEESVDIRVIATSYNSWTIQFTDMSRPEDGGRYLYTSPPDVGGR